MIPVDLPRYTIWKRMADGGIAYYFNVPGDLRAQKCPVENEPLGRNLEAAKKRADNLNRDINAWRARNDADACTGHVRVGTVDWLIKEYRASDEFKDRVSGRSKPDYERALNHIADLMTLENPPRRTGTLTIKSISARAAKKIHKRIKDGGRGNRKRTANLSRDIARRAWKVVAGDYPEFFRTDHMNPWTEVDPAQGKMQRAAIERHHVYAFAEAAIAAGHGGLAGAAIAAFEWLQRPENVLAGHLTWSRYRGRDAPDCVKIIHHKTKEETDHPLEDMDDDGAVTLFYPEAERLLAHVPKTGLAIAARSDGRLYDRHEAAKIIRDIRAKAGLPNTFTLDACRHGGMTELEEAELTRGQGKALSGHKSDRAYSGYAKRTKKRAVAAAKKRRAYRVAQNKE